MPRFSYIALDHNRKTSKGSVSAESSYAARKHLRTKGLHPTVLKELAADRETKSLRSIFRRNSKGQVGEFTKQMATMLNAGIKLTEALTVLTQQMSDEQFRNAIGDVKDRVITGESFADALSEYDDYFDIVYISMVRVGEVTGTLASSLASISAFTEKRKRLESKMTTAMIYPIILVVICIIVVLFLTIKVIPVIGEQIESAGQELPGITKAFMATSSILTSWWAFVIIAVIIAIVLAYKRFVSTEKGAFIRDRFILALPLFGPLIRQRIVSRFASTLSTLLGSGLSMANSLQVVAEVTGNTIMNKAVKQARERILSGADIATPLRESGVIDPTIAHMVTVGEKSGELEKMLKMISDNLEESSDVVIDRLSALIEPIIIVGMAMVIGLIAYATLLPIIKYSAGQF